MMYLHKNVIENFLVFVAVVELNYYEKNVEKNICGNDNKFWLLIHLISVQLYNNIIKKK